MQWLIQGSGSKDGDGDLVGLSYEPWDEEKVLSIGAVTVAHTSKSGNGAFTRTNYIIIIKASWIMSNKSLILLFESLVLSGWCASSHIQGNQTAIIPLLPQSHLVVVTASHSQSVMESSLYNFLNMSRRLVGPWPWHLLWYE